MTRQETGIVMNILTTAYPRFYAGKDAPDPGRTLSLWAEMFADDDVELVAAAVKALIATDDKGFPPHIGAVKAKMRQITTPGQMSALEAWELVYKAIKRSGYNSKEEFEKLPPAIQRLVGAPSQLKDWALMDAGTVQSVISSNFQKSYQARAKQETEYQALPSDIKQMIGGLAGRLALGNGNNQI